MCLILNIETATTVCSVSVSKNGDLLEMKELDAGFTHAENLHLFISEILKKAHLQPAQLKAIAVSKGPGSYTGLRIGTSTAKGLAYALNIPMIAIDTLSIMALKAFTLMNENAFYCPMIDARRMEVFTCVYGSEIKPQIPVEALIVDEESIKKLGQYPKIYFFGNGMPKCKEILAVLPNADFIENVNPSAEFMCRMAFEKYEKKDFVDVAYFEPFYLKDFLIVGKKESR